MTFIIHFEMTRYWLWLQCFKQRIRFWGINPKVERRAKTAFEKDAETVMLFLS